MPARRLFIGGEGATRQGWDARFLLSDFTSVEITLCRPAVSASACGGAARQGWDARVRVSLSITAHSVLPVTWRFGH